MLKAPHASPANGTRSSPAPRIAIRLPPLRFLSFSDLFTRQPPWKAAASGILPAVSYDLYLLPERAGEDPLEVLERLEEDLPASEDDRARVRALVAALRAALPALEDNTGDVAGANEAHLLDPDGCEVSVYPTSASVSFPYWDSLDAAALVQDLARVAGVVEEHTGWRMYDPQQEAWIDPLRDADGFRDAFDHGRAIIRDIAAEDS
jgi:hypothetical protein